MANWKQTMSGTDRLIGIDKSSGAERVLASVAQEDLEINTWCWHVYAGHTDHGKTGSRKAAQDAAEKVLRAVVRSINVALK